MARKRQVPSTQLAFDLWSIPDEPDPAVSARVNREPGEPVPAEVKATVGPGRELEDFLQIIPIGFGSKEKPAHEADSPQQERPAAAVFEPNPEGEAGVWPALPSIRGFDGDVAPATGHPPKEGAVRPTASRERRAATSPKRGPEGRVRDGLAVARLVAELRASGQLATAEERAVLAAWPGWGGAPQLFDERSKRFEAERAELKELWTDKEWNSARRTTVNAHYTDPAYAGAMWRMLHGLGLDGGRVLEPGSGSGNFLGLAPEAVQMVGVELDPITAEISRHLHPRALVRTESFVDTPLDGEGFDAAIGNVPFAQVKLFDKTHNPDRFSLHNYFTVKSLALTKPGGLVAVLSSRYTLDSQNEKVRRRIYESADLVGAVRLPGGAHKSTAGTDVITDLLVFRKRLPGESAGDDSWLRTEKIDQSAGQVRMNSWLLARPNLVLGSVELSTGMYGQDELDVVYAGSNLVADFERATQSLVQLGRDAGLTWAAAGQRASHWPSPALAAVDGGMVVGTLTVEDGEIWAEGLGGNSVVEAPPAVKAELVKLLEVRSSAVALLEAEAQPAYTDEGLDVLRARLNESYDSYRAEFGPINRVDLIPVRGAKGESDAVRRRYPAATVLLRQDPHAATVMALEVFDEETQKARKSDLFARRVVGAVLPAPQIESPADALAVVVDRVGVVDVDAIAQLLNTSAEEAQRALLRDGLVFVAPDSLASDGLVLVPRAEYLSGNVRAKLAAAQAVQESHGGFEANVAELTAVLPAPFGPAEIDVRMGAGWVPLGFYKHFIMDHTQARTVDVERVGDGPWQIKIGAFPESRRHQISVPEMSVQQLMLRVMNNGKLTIEREDAEGRKYLDSDATELLRAKADALVEAFQSWLWAEPARAEQAATIYNKRFNSLVLRSYDDAELSLPGKAADFTPRPHQVAAVARMISEPAAGLFHEVGAGKTAEMVMGVMELRRLGLVSKPVIVVPNHLVDQFTREFKQIYPLAKLMSASSGDVAQSSGRDARRVFVARASTGDWDAVIMTRSAFTRVGLSPAVEEKFLSQKIDTERERLAALASSTLGRSRVKGQEKAIMALEERLKVAMDMPRDRGVSFEGTGIDYLVVDEAHGYKNLAVQSSFEGLSKPVGSNLATDLEMKLQYLRDAGKTRVVTLATATPMANGLQELYVMQSYLRPDLLVDAGLTNADEWARQFTEEVSQVEVGPAGDYRMKTRIGKFKNLPELLTMFHVAGDVKTAADLGLPVPLLPQRADGRRSPSVVVVPATSQSKEFQADIGERAIAIRAGVDPTVDNMLKLSNDARSAALDMRLYDPELLPRDREPTKASVAAAEIMKIHRAFQNTKYRDAFGDLAETPGGVQLVFSDRGTPSEVRFSVYDELKKELVAAGMDATRVRFIHDAATDDEKDAIFAACRAGAVSVLVGSTEKMGTGTNIQLRATALHHLDCPWRPADVIQREGRVIRQGNQNAEVNILRYVQAGSFDAFMWQTVTRKAIAAEQIMSGKIVGRELEMVSAEVFSFAEAMAMSNDDPRIVERIELDSEIQKMQRLQRGFNREKTALRGRIADYSHQVQTLPDQLAAVKFLVENGQSTAGESFEGFVTNHVYQRPGNPRRYRSRTEMGLALKAALAPIMHGAPPQTLEGHPLHGLWVGVGSAMFQARHFVSIGGGVHTVKFRMLDNRFMTRSINEEVSVPVGDLTEMAPHLLIARLENRVAALADRQQELALRLSDAVEQHRLLDLQAQSPFPRLEELRALEHRRAEVIAAMTASAGGPVRASTPPTAVGGGRTGLGELPPATSARR